MFKFKMKVITVLALSSFLILSDGSNIDAQTIKAGSISTITLQPNVKVTNKPIVVLQVNKKTKKVVKKFVLPANSLIKINGQRLVNVNQPTTKQTELITKAKNYIYSNKTTTLSVNQQIKMYHLGQAWHKSLTINQTKALVAYTGAEYSIINGSLRGTNNPTKKVTTQIKNIDQGLAKFKLPYNFTVWRGTSLTNVKASLGNKPLKIGVVFNDKGYMSTSLLKSVANNFKSDALLKIQVPKGLHGADLAALSNFKEEDEYLINHNTKLIVTGIAQGIGKKIITLNFA